MSDKMTPIPFGNLMNWILEERKSNGTVFGVHRPYHAKANHEWQIFKGKLETPFGTAAGPHTQLAQNIIAGYYAGARFFELKTVQILDGEDLPVSKPCIRAEDECYNVEWSTELYVPQALAEYIKAWVALHVLSKEFGLGATDGFQFNMSVGYDLDGIKSPKIDNFIEGLKDATHTKAFLECLDWLTTNIDLFEHLTMDDVRAIPTTICNSVTLSTLHGCPPQEIERIAVYLLTEKNLNTFVKCNPTLLGYDDARSILDQMGYDYLVFGDFHFKDDLQYDDAVPMIKRLMALADDQNLEFGVKITNTFPVDIAAEELPGNEMYMSGKSLFPLSMSVAEKLSKDLNGQLRISYSGGADFFNIEKVVSAGIFPVTMATTVLKDGGYQRLEQIAKIWSPKAPVTFQGVDAEAVSKLVREGIASPHHKKSLKMPLSRKIDKTVPLINCFTAPCQSGCPIEQDITAYINLVEQGKYKEAYEVIVEKNPLPFMTGTICAHFCMTKCTHNFYESPVNIRRIKLEAAEKGFDAFKMDFKKPQVIHKGKAAVIGGGPAGLAAAYFLAREGVDTTIFEKEEKLGGVVRNVIAGFRISDEAIDKDVKLVEMMGVKFTTATTVSSIADLKKEYDSIIVSVGAPEQGVLKIGDQTAWNAIDFLTTCKQKDRKLEIGRNVVVVGGGNTAMDAARMAKRVTGVEKVTMVYRRTKRYMPADEEEILLALEDNIFIEELLSPVEWKEGHLSCRKMKLTGKDASGRSGFEATDEIVVLDADTVVAAIGEQVPTSFYQKNGLELNSKGYALVNEETLESSVNGVYVIGDGLGGPSTVVEVIRDARKAAEGVLKKVVVKDHFIRMADEEIYNRKGVLKDEDGSFSDSSRCLHCNSVCEICTEVCPNRANVSVTVPGMSSRQIIHVDYMCNECGNCMTFCPYESAPYLDKFTMFTNVADFKNSKNSGFALKEPGGKECLVRLGENEFLYTLGERSEELSEDLRKLIQTVVTDYSYLFL